MFNVRFLIWFFKLLSITLPLVIAAKILFLKCYPCIVILLGLPSSRSSYILQSPPPPHHKKLKPQIIIRIIKASVLPERYQEKECSCFDFLAHSMFTFDVFCGSLCTSTLVTQVWLQIKLDPEYIPDYIFVSYDYGWNL